VKTSKVYKLINYTNLLLRLGSFYLSVQVFHCVFCFIVKCLVLLCILMLDISVLYVLLLVDICVHGCICPVHVVIFVCCYLICMCGVLRCTSCTKFDVA
jgi:hypothetical protein